LCRLALGGHGIDAASFTSVRIASGAFVLVLLQRFSPTSRASARAGWRAAGLLFAYAACFSFAYGSLATGTGALILFGCVQVTMLLVALRAGERLTPIAWLGLSSAALGLGVLVFPGLSAPDPRGAVLMAFAGAAWGGYTLYGRGSRAPLADTARNFVFATPLALVVSAFAFRSATLTRSGVVLAVISGAVTSGVGYSLWYTALRALSAVQASVLQLCVPVLATAAGIVFLGEVLSGRVLLASCMILGGVALVINARQERKSRPAAQN
ncbi:MAG TPA: EamA family transporter, partial [Polyangiaceae bacterium]|nr:EamA family transporter [Polyangiaceae bacterium]